MTPARAPPMPAGVGQGERLRAAGVVLLDRDQARHALAVDELAADQVTGALRRDHDHVDVGRRLDVAEPDVEAVPEGERLAGGQVRLDGLGVDVPLHVVRGQDHDHVGLGRRLGRRDHPQALVGGLHPGLRALGQPDPDVDARVAQAQRVRVPLRAVADDGDLAPLDDRQVGVVVVEDLHGHCVVFLLSGVRDRGGVETGRWARRPGTGGAGLPGLVCPAARRGDRPRSPTERHHAGLDQLAHPERLQHLDQRLQLVAGPGGLDGHRVRGDVDDPGRGTSRRSRRSAAGSRRPTAA